MDASPVVHRPRTAGMRRADEPDAKLGDTAVGGRVALDPADHLLTAQRARRLASRNRAFPVFRLESVASVRVQKRSRSALFGHASFAPSGVRVAVKDSGGRRAAATYVPGETKRQATQDLARTFRRLGGSLVRRFLENDNLVSCWFRSGASAFARRSCSRWS